MRDSPLSLKEYFTTHLAFFAIPAFDSKASNYRIDIDDLDVSVHDAIEEDNVRRRALQITVELKDSVSGKYPYDFSISLVGYFEVTPSWPEEYVDSLVSSNAPALLYSAARHAIATATGTGPFSKITLPSVSFVPPPKELEGDQAAVDSQHVAQKKRGRPKKLPAKATPSRP